MLSKSGIHAVRALALLAQLPEGSYVGAAAIASATGAPSNYLGKLLQTLARRGVLQSQKGMGGGFRLARDPQKITLYEVIDALEDVTRWSSCVLGRPKCSDENPCPIHTRWSAVRESYLNVLRQTRIADLVPMLDAESGESETSKHFEPRSGGTE